MGKAPEKLRVNPALLGLQEPRPSHDQRRLRGHLPSEAAAAGLPDADLRRRRGDLSLPCVAREDAPPADRHRALQVRRLQGEPVHQGGAQPGLLEAGPALSRRHRVHHHEERGDGDDGLRLGQVRHDVSLQRDDPDHEGHQAADAVGDVRDHAGHRQPPPPHQSCHPAVRQPRCAAGDGAGPRPPGVHRHPRRRPGRHRRGAAAAAGRTMGHAARHAEGPAGIWRPT